MIEDKNQQRHVLLICGAFTSANFYVMLSVIRAMGNYHIHAVSANNEDKLVLPVYEDVSYYHIHNWRLSTMSWINRIPITPVSKLLDFLFSRTTALYDAFFTSKYERNIYSQSISIIENNEIESIFSVCLRFYTYRIAIKLHQKTGIKWYQFWVDPYSNRKEGGKLWKKAAEKLECRFLDSVSHFYALPEVFVGSTIIEHYTSKLRTFEIPYLEERMVNTTTKDIIFAGAFIKKVRDPYPVLKLLLSILDLIDKDVRFHFYVKKKEEFNEFIGLSQGRIVFHDYVGHEELYRNLSNSYMLLNIGNAGSIQMPSKTVEYVSFRKPLLFFYKDKKDPSLRYLEGYPDICQINVDDDFEVNKNKLEGFLAKEHIPIAYSELMKVKAFRESTPSYIKSMLQEDL